MKTKNHKPEKIHEYVTKPNGKNDTGRPCLYNPEYCKDIVDYFCNAPRTERVLKSHTTGKNEYEKDEYETIPCELPTIGKWARKIGVTHRTVDEWAKEYKEFSLALEEAKSVYKDFLNDNGLAGYYSSIYAKFVATNTTDMKDKVEQQLTGKDGGAIIINYPDGK